MKALVNLGFEVRHAGKGVTMLRRGGHVVMVPDVDVLADGMLDAILRSAGVSAHEISVATRPTRSGTYPRQRGDDEQG